MSKLPRMISDNLLIEMVEDLEKKGMLFIPKTKHSRPNKARVLAAGPGRFVGEHRAPMRVRAGDLVVIDAYMLRLVLADGAMANAQGTPLADVGERAVVRESDVIAVIGSHCPECGTLGLDVRFDRDPGDGGGAHLGMDARASLPTWIRESDEEPRHFQCPHCRALWGVNKLYSYHHTSAEVRALEAR